MQIAGERKLTSQEEKDLNQLYKQSTQIMLKVERNIKGHNNTYPQSPGLHDSVRTVSIWKAKITQYKIHVSHHNQIEFLTKSMKTLIDTSQNHQSELKKNLRCVIRDFNKIRNKAQQLKDVHLMKRASAMNIANKSSSVKIIINIQKI